MGLAAIFERGERDELPVCSVTLRHARSGAVVAPANTLAVVSYLGSAEDYDGTSSHVVLPVGSVIADKPVEVWESVLPVTFGGDGAGLRWTANGEFMFVSSHLRQDGRSSLETVVRRVYEDALRTIAEHGYHTPVRIWNFLNDLNRGEGDNERYRRFCTGRAEALGVAKSSGLAVSPPPAATCVGSERAGLTMHVLASSRGCFQVENPRQVSAYRYPSTYGPRSPLFSRAAVQQWRDRLHIHVSGTAAIVGHKSRHLDDIGRQVDETLVNVEALLQEIALRFSPTDLPSLSLGCLAYVRAYVRHAADAGLVYDAIRCCAADDVVVAVVQADLCRKELLVELEGFASVELS